MKKGYGNSMAMRKDEFSDDKRRAGKSKRRPRLVIDVDDETRRKIKIIATREDLTVNGFLLPILKQIVEERFHDEEHRQRKPATRKMLEELEQVSQEIMRERQGKPFEDSSEMIREMREERSRELENL